MIFVKLLVKLKILDDYPIILISTSISVHSLECWDCHPDDRKDCADTSTNIYYTCQSDNDSCTIVIGYDSHGNRSKFQLKHTNFYSKNTTEIQNIAKSKVLKFINFRCFKRLCRNQKTKWLQSIRQMEGMLLPEQPMQFQWVISNSHQ